ncbi:unnamed protein product [Caenorhabditis angaria]|uniref:Uncharacterized protein n=1 Tax=Caenorhabditis angaria TaxID=860376 RepID=A0A9P1IVT7_9PELO|nr:unnamed protein product [Caenorhabditis angaria]
MSNFWAVLLIFGILVLKWSHQKCRQDCGPVRFETRNYTLVDKNGRKCRGSIDLAICDGCCESSELGSHVFPYNVQMSTACFLVETSQKTVQFTDCDWLAEHGIRNVRIPHGEKCECREIPSRFY